MTSAPAHADAPLTDLSRVLWRQRRLLERLHYHLRVQELILAGGDDALLLHAVADVQHTLEAVSRVEDERASVSGPLGESLGLGPEASLQELVDAAPEPYDQILAEHRDAFLALAADITTTSLNGRDQLERGLALTRQLASFVMGDVGDGGYDRTGASVQGSAERRLVDRTL